MPLSLSFRGGAVRFSFFLVAFGCLFLVFLGFFPFGNKFLFIQKKKTPDVELPIDFRKICSKILFYPF